MGQVGLVGWGSAPCKGLQMGRFVLIPKSKPWTNCTFVCSQCHWTPMVLLLVVCMLLLVLPECLMVHVWGE